MKGGLEGGGEKSRDKRKRMQRKKGGRKEIE